MDSPENRARWEVHQLLCYLACDFQKISCDLGGKALGPMPPRRESLQKYGRAFKNISVLFLSTSSKLRSTMSRNTTRSNNDLLIGTALPKLVKIWKLLLPVFDEFCLDITRWACGKKQSMAVHNGANQDGDARIANPLNPERYELMNDLVSFAEVSVVEILFELTPLLGKSFETASDILMKLGRDISSRRKNEQPQLPEHLILYDFLSVGIVMPFQNAPYRDYLASNPFSTLNLEIFNCLHFHSESPHYHTSVPADCYPPPASSSIAVNYPSSEPKYTHPRTDLAQKMLSESAQAVPQVLGTEVWIGRDLTSQYEQDSEAGLLLLRDSIKVAGEGRRLRQNVVCLYPSRLLFFRQRRLSLVVQYDICRADIFLVLYFHKLGSFAQVLVQVVVHWKSPSTEPRSIAFVQMQFDDAEKAKIWAGILAPEPWSHKETLSTLAPYIKESSVSIPELRDTRETTDANTVQLQPPLWSSSSEYMTLERVQRLLRNIKTQDVDLLDYRVVSISDELEALIICDQRTDISHAAMDVSLDGGPIDIDKAAVWSRKCLDFLPYNSEKYPGLMDHLGEYLSKCNGRVRESQLPDYPNRYIEVPIASILSNDLGSDHANNFRGALDRFVNTFMCPKPSSMSAGLKNEQVDKKYREFFETRYQPLNMKLLVYSRESLGTLEEWVRESILPAKQPLSMSSTTIRSASPISQVQIEETIDYKQALVGCGTPIQLALEDDADIENTGQTLNQSKNPGTEEKYEKGVI